LKEEGTQTHRVKEKKLYQTQQLKESFGKELSSPAGATNALRERTGDCLQKAKCRRGGISIMETESKRWLVTHKNEGYRRELSTKKPNPSNLIKLKSSTQRFDQFEQKRRPMIGQQKNSKNQAVKRGRRKVFSTKNAETGTETKSSGEQPSRQTR